MWEMYKMEYLSYKFLKKLPKVDIAKLILKIVQNEVYKVWFDNKALWQQDRPPISDM